MAAGGHAQFSSLSGEPGGTAGAVPGDFTQEAAGTPAGYGVLERAEASAGALVGAMLIRFAML